ncbi:hypothetical protein Mapa_014849 [Marchantia paleacea]|nr:hypothetical protein Mapa_014849 [Marchantia paleacea]
MMTITGGFTLHFSSVKVPMAFTCRTLERVQSSFFPAGHKFPASINGVAPNAGSMVFEAFSVFDNLLSLTFQRSDILHAGAVAAGQQLHLRRLVMASVAT